MNRALSVLTTSPSWMLWHVSCSLVISILYKQLVGTEWAEGVLPLVGICSAVASLVSLFVVLGIRGYCPTWRLYSRETMYVDVVRGRCMFFPKYC